MYTMKKFFVMTLALAAFLLGGERASAQFIYEDATKDGVRMVQALPEGICARNIAIQVKDDVILSVKFTRGCPGNAAGVAKLVEGMKIKDAIRKLEEIPCGNREVNGHPTSCPDQFAQVLKMMSGQAEYRSKTPEEVKAMEEERARRAPRR